MKSKNNLNRALRDALYEHQVPLNDSQWERINKELMPKPKRRFLPWFFIFTAVIAGSSIVAYLNYNNDDVISNSRATESHSAAPVNSNTIEANKSNSNSSSPKINNEVNEANTNNGHPTLGNIDPSSIASLKPNAHPSAHERRAKLGESNKPIVTKSDNIRSGIYKVDAEDGNLYKEENPVRSMNEEDYRRFLRMSSIQPLRSPFIYTIGSPIFMYLTDGLKLEPRRPKKNNNNNVNSGRWTFGFHSGFNMIKTTANAITNPEKLHMDSKAIFDLANKSQVGYNIQLSAEYQPIKTLALTVSGGLQYKKVYNNVNFEYRFTSYADRDSLDNITNYRVDSASAPIFRIRESQSYTFMILPIKVNYHYRIGSKHELSIGGGMVFGSIIGSSGRSFMVNDIKMSTVGATLNRKHGMGYIGSLGYTYNIGGKWWLGFETQIQTLNMQYNLHYGLLNARMRNSGFGVNIKYRM